MKKIRLVVIILLAIALVWWSVYNVKNNSNFLTASLANIVTIGLAVFVSYFLTQRGNNKRRQKDIVYGLLQDLYQQVSSDEAYKLSGQSKEKINMRNRDMNNKISILEGLKSDLISPKDLSLIRKSFNEYRDFIGDHIENIAYLSQSEKELKRPLDVIESKLLALELALYT